MSFNPAYFTCPMRGINLLPFLTSLRRLGSREASLFRIQLLFLTKIVLMLSVKSAIAFRSAALPPLFSLSMVMVLKSPPINQGTSSTWTNSILDISPNLLVLGIRDSFSSSVLRFLSPSHHTCSC